MKEWRKLLWTQKNRVYLPLRLSELRLMNVQMGDIYRAKIDIDKRTILIEMKRPHEARVVEFKEEQKKQKQESEVAKQIASLQDLIDIA